MNAHTRIFWQVTENKLRINYDTHKEGDMIALQSKITNGVTYAAVDEKYLNFKVSAGNWEFIATP